MKTHTPYCLGIIMDGNRRWAKEHNLPTFEGHTKGLGNFDHAARWARDAGIKHLVVYALSTENWNRSEEEVAHLMEIFRSAMNDAFKRIKEEKGRLHFIGDIDRFPKDIAENMRQLETDTQEHDDFHVWVCASYGGRMEIVRAAEKLRAQGVEITDDSLRSTLWSAEMPDPDLIIRSGGEKRLSNFLTWQGVYAELVFSDTYWPAFTQEEFQAILEQYGSRERRYGK